MAWRKWVVRGLVFATVAGLAVAGFAYQHWTDPAEVIWLRCSPRLDADLPPQIDVGQRQFLGDLGEVLAPWLRRFLADNGPRFRRRAA